MNTSTFVTFVCLGWGERVATLRFGRNRHGPVHAAACMLCDDVHFEGDTLTFVPAAKWVLEHLQRHHDHRIDGLYFDESVSRPPDPRLVSAALADLESAWGFPFAQISLVTWHGDSKARVPA